MIRIDVRRALKQLSFLDYLVLIIFLVLTVVGILYFSRARTTVYVYTVNITTGLPDWQQDPIPSIYWIANSIQKGDKAYGPAGDLVAEVVGIDNAEWGGQRRFLRLKLKVNAFYDRRTKQYRLNDQPLQIGTTLSLDIGKTKYQGMISYVGKTLEPLGSEYKYVELGIKAPLVQPWLAVTYDSSFRVKNSDGKEIFRILQSTSVPAQVSLSVGSTQLVQSTDPILKDVYITAVAYVRCQEDVCYYNEMMPVKVGDWIWTQSETYQCRRRTGTAAGTANLFLYVPIGVYRSLVH
jgi:hypothetical protein